MDITPYTPQKATDINYLITIQFEDLFNIFWMFINLTASSVNETDQNFVNSTFYLRIEREKMIKTIAIISKPHLTTLQVPWNIKLTVLNMWKVELSQVICRFMARFHD